MKQLLSISLQEFTELQPLTLLSVAYMNYFCGIVDRRKALMLYFHPGPLSEPPANLRQAVSSI